MGIKSIDFIGLPGYCAVGEKKWPRQTVVYMPEDVFCGIFPF